MLQTFKIKIPVTVESPDGGTVNVQLDTPFEIEAETPQQAAIAFNGEILALLQRRVTEGREDSALGQQTNDPYPTNQDAEDLSSFNNELVQVIVQLKQSKKVCAQLRGRTAETGNINPDGQSCVSARNYLAEADKLLRRLHADVDLLVTEGFLVAAVAAREAVHGPGK